MRNYIPKNWRLNPHRWNYLNSYCRQYPQWKQDRNDISLSYRASASGGVAVRSSSELSPVEQKADRLYQLDEKISKVESSVRIAVREKPWHYAAVLRMMTEGGRRYEDFEMTGLSARQLSEYRKKVIYELNQKVL